MATKISVASLRPALNEIEKDEPRVFVRPLYQPPSSLSTSTIRNQVPKSFEESLDVDFEYTENPDSCLLLLMVRNVMKSRGFNYDFMNFCNRLTTHFCGLTHLRHDVEAGGYVIAHMKFRTYDRSFQQELMSNLFYWSDEVEDKAKQATVPTRQDLVAFHWHQLTMDEKKQFFSGDSNGWFCRATGKWA